MKSPSTLWVNQSNAAASAEPLGRNPLSPEMADLKKSAAKHTAPIAAPNTIVTKAARPLARFQNTPTRNTAVILVEWSGGATGLDQWIPMALPFRASWQTAIRSCRRFPRPLGSSRTASFPWYGWKPAWSLRALPQPSPAALDAEPAFLSISGSVSRYIGWRRCPQALGSAWFIIPAPAIATTA